MAYKIEVPDENNEKPANFVESLTSKIPVTPVTVVTEPVKASVFSSATANRVVTSSVTTGNQPADPTEGPMIAVLIDSPIVGPVWFALDDGWKSGDDIPVFYASEIPHLQQMGAAELRKWYEQKLALGSGWIRDRVEEPTKH